MEQGQLPDDGTAELVLLRAILPFSLLAWLVGCVAYFAGWVPAQAALGDATRAILRVSTYAGGFGLALAVATVRLARAPRIALPKGWVLLKVGTGVLSIGLALTFLRLVTGA